MTSMITKHPKHSSTDKAEIAEPKSKGGSVQDRKREIWACTNGSIQDHDRSDNDMARSNSRKSLQVREIRHRFSSEN